MRPGDWFLRVVEETTTRVDNWPEWKRLSDIELDDKNNSDRETGRGVSQAKESKSE